MTFMTHPEHGATNTAEVAAHEALGWKVSTNAEWLALAGKAECAPEAAAIETQIVQDAPKKRGPKPKGI